jgi:hypothetical protein
MKKKVQECWQKMGGNQLRNAVRVKIVNKGLSSVAEQKMTEEIEKYFRRQNEVVRLDGVSVERVSNDDPRETLRGQSKLVASKNLPAYFMVGPYAGKYYDREHFRSMQMSVAQQQAVDDYSFDLSTTILTDAGDVNSEKISLTVNPYPRFGNETMTINDPYPLQTGDNVIFIEATFQDWPYLFVFVKGEEIKKGAELMILYGDGGYFKHRIGNEVGKVLERQQQDKSMLVLQRKIQRVLSVV